MKTLAEASNNKLEYSAAGADGDRLIRAQVDGVYRIVGTLMPPASQATLEASPGIQRWSNPRGKVATRMFDPDAVRKFAIQWSRNWAMDYPLDNRAALEDFNSKS